MESTAASGANKRGLPNYEAYLRNCLETQTIDYLLSKPACFNLLAVGEDGLGKVTLLETLFGVRAAGLREAKKAAAACGGAADAAAQIVTEKLCLQGATETAMLSSSSSSSQDEQPQPQGNGRLTVRLMTSVNYSPGETCRSPWVSVAEFLAKQVTGYLNGRAANPFDFRPEDDDRVHCCLFFLPPLGGRGLRRCDAAALKCLEDKVNLVPVLAKSDCYTADEMAERKAAVAADLQRHGICVHQFLTPQQQPPQQPRAGQRLLAAPLAVMGAPHPELTRSLPWGSVSVEDERFSDVMALRTLIVEKNMLILRKTTKKFHSSIQKFKVAPTLPRK